MSRLKLEQRRSVSGWPISARILLISSLLWCGAAAAESTVLVDQIFLDPPAIALHIDDDLRVVVGGTKVPIDQLDFRVYQLVDGTWQIIRNWKPWPLKPFRSVTAGPSALQVDVRQRGTPKIQKKWIGSFYFDKERRDFPSLYRVVSSAFFERDDRDGLTDKVAAVLNLLYPALAGGADPKCLQACTVDTNAGAGVTRFHSADQQLSISGGLAEWQGSPLGLRLSQFEHYPQLLSQVRAVQPEVSLELLYAVFSAQTIHRGFWTGTPTDGLTRSHFETLSMCNTFSFSLLRLLQHLGVEAHFVSYENARGGAHAFVRVVTAEQEVLVDAMEGRVIFGSLIDAIHGRPLPSVRLMVNQQTGINLQEELPHARGVWISESVDLDRGQAMHRAPSKIVPAQLRATP